jgi:hypothetical protein
VGDARRAAAALVSVLALASEPARAAEEGAPRARKESPQHFAIELRFAPYWPAIDSEPGLTGKPYQELFGTMPRLLFSGEIDWQALRIAHFGSVGPGFSFGYTQMSAPAPLTSGAGFAAEDTNLEVFPFYAVVVLRVDVLARDFKIPIVPYAKAGLAMTIWRTFTASGTSSFDGQNGFGTTWGEQFAVGAALSLDWLDARASKLLDDEAGVNHTYLFGEWMLANLDNFGSAGALRVGTMTFCGGLAVEF